MSFYVGQTCEAKITVTEQDILSFAKLSGDYNPVHIDPEYAKTTIFKKQIAHGALINSYVSTLLGMEMPGKGTIYLSQESRFLKPVFVDDEITVSLKIIEITEKGRAYIETCVFNSNGEKTLDGKAYVVLPNETNE